MSHVSCLSSLVGLMSPVCLMSTICLMSPVCLTSPVSFSGLSVNVDQQEGGGGDGPVAVISEMQKICLQIF